MIGQTYITDVQRIMKLGKASKKSTKNKCFPWNKLRKFDKMKGYKVYVYKVSDIRGWNGPFELLCAYAEQVVVIGEHIVVVVKRGINSRVDEIIDEEKI
jgi:hypothetical protein